jgi:hypothetical protein
MSVDYMKSTFGIEYSIDRTVLIVNNGDGDAIGVHVEGVTYLRSSNSLWCVLNRTLSGLVRVNFMIFHNLANPV